MTNIIMTFKVYAGTIFCGTLGVFVNNPYPTRHLFTPLRGWAIHGFEPIQKVGNYKQLKLVRID